MICIVLTGTFLIRVDYKLLRCDLLQVAFEEETFEKNIVRLTNQLWKLIPMRENNEDWQKQLKTVIIEIAGLSELFTQEPQFLQLLSKLEGLLIIETDFSIYRKTVFESIGLLRKCI